MKEKRLLKKINFIKLYQIIGGLVGIAIMLYAVLTTNLDKYQNAIGYVTLICPFIFFGVCIYSGILLNNKKFVLGFRLVVIGLLFQVVAFEMFGVFYSAINGIGIKATLNLTNDVIAGFDFHPSHFLLQPIRNGDSFIIKINLIALIILFYALNIIKEIENQDVKNKL